MAAKPELTELDLLDPCLHAEDAHWPVFEALRRQDPVHYHESSRAGPYWSLTTFDHIITAEKHPEIFSSASGIVIEDYPAELSPAEVDGFISMDSPEHEAARSVVQPVVAPRNLAQMESLIRERVIDILDQLPVGTPFNWVPAVSIELTTRMLATLFDFPFEERANLTRWSDIIAGDSEVVSEEERYAAMMECLAAFLPLWDARKGYSDGLDLITLLANGEATENMTPEELMGMLTLLIIGGNDTTRNSITGGVLALNTHPVEYEKLRADPSLISSMVPEIIRWQTPLAYMRRTVTQDTELGGKRLRAGDKVALWFVSGNRDESAVERANEFIIDRKNPRHHLSFGFGLHRCMGNRLAEMQLRIVWEEVMKRFSFVELVGDPVRIRSSFIRGYSELPVILRR